MKIVTEIICIQCGAKYLGGQLFHGVRIISVDGGIDHIEHYCAPCADYVFRAMWPEDREPYPGVPIPVAKGQPS